MNRPFKSQNTMKIYWRALHHIHFCHQSPFSSCLRSCWKSEDARRSALPRIFCVLCGSAPGLISHHLRQRLDLRGRSSHQCESSANLFGNYLLHWPALHQIFYIVRECIVFFCIGSDYQNRVSTSTLQPFVWSRCRCQAVGWYAVFVIPFYRFLRLFLFFFSLYIITPRGIPLNGRNVVKYIWILL